MRLYQRFIRTATRFVEPVEMPGKISAVSGVGIFC